MSDLVDVACSRALLWAARFALRVQGPLAAKRTVDRVARRLPKYPSLEAAGASLESLAGRGSCLSRALAVAARLPGASVVIGVNPRLSASLYAHAWVEANGMVLDASDQRSHVEEIARLR